MDTHWSDLNVSFDSMSRKSFSSLLAPGPGLKSSALPHSTHVSILFPPTHQPPGAGFPGMRPRIFSSMRSRTGSSLRNGEANAAPLLLRWKRSLELRCRASCPTLKAEYCKLWLIMVLLNWRELHIKVWKYTDWDEGVFDTYISRVLAKFSVPNMQNSINLRLNITDLEPA